MLIDLHVHTSHSEDFTTTVKDAVERCRSRGISAIALAEFDTIPDSAEIAAISSELDYPIFIGVDIDTDDGRVIGIPRDPSDDRFVSQFWDKGENEPLGINGVLEAFEALDGVVLATHPYLDDGGPYLGDRVYKFASLAGIEVVCGVKQSFRNDMALEAAASMALPTIGGSDSGPEGQRLGNFATAFADNITTQTELVDAVREGACWAVEIGKPGTFKSRPNRPRRDKGRGRGRRSGNHR